MKRLASVVMVGVLVLLAALPVRAQDGGADGSFQVITGANIDQLVPVARLGRGSVNAVAWSPDGSALLASSTAGVWQYDAADISAEPVLLAGTESGASNAAYSPDGSLLAVGKDGSLVAAGADGSPLVVDRVRIWDVATGELVTTLEGAGGLWMLWSEDGTRLVTGSREGIVALWDVTTGEQIAEVAHLRNSTLNAVAFSPDGAWIAWGDSGGAAKVWDVAAGEIAATLQHDSETVGAVLVLPLPILAMRFSPDSSTLVTLTHTETNPLPKGAALRYWDLGDLSEPREMVKDGLITLWGIEYVDSGDLFGIGEAGETVGVWNMTSGKAITSLAVTLDAGSTAAFSPDGAQLAVGNYGGTIQLWDVTAGELVAEAEGHAITGLRHIAYDPEHGRLATQSNTEVMLWDLATGDLLFKDSGLFYGVALSPDGWMLVGSFGNVLLYDLSQVDDPAYRPIDSGQIHLSAIEDVVFSPDGTLAATSCSFEPECTVAIWDWATGEIVDRLTPGELGARNLMFVGSGDRLYLAMDVLGGRIAVWDVTDVTTTGATFVQEFGATDEYGFMDYAVDPTGTLLVASQQFFENGRMTDESALSLWDVRSGRHLTDWDTNDGLYAVLGFTPDGTQVLVNGGPVEDACLHVYDAATGAVVGTHEECLFFPSQDGTLLTSSSRGNMLTVWGVPGR